MTNFLESRDYFPLLYDLYIIVLSNHLLSNSTPKLQLRNKYNKKNPSLRRWDYIQSVSWELNMFVVARQNEVILTKSLHFV